MKQRLTRLSLLVGVFFVSLFVLFCLFVLPQHKSRKSQCFGRKKKTKKKQQHCKEATFLLVTSAAKQPG